MTAPLAPLGARVTIVDHVANRHAHLCLDVIDPHDGDEPCGGWYCARTCIDPVDVDAIVTATYDDGSVDVLPIGAPVTDAWTLLPSEVERRDYEVQVVAVWAPAAVVLPELETVG